MTLSTAQGRRLVALLLLVIAVLLTACGSPFRQAQTTPQWMTYDASQKTVTVQMIAGYRGAFHNPPFNFDGASHGALQLKVPVGWKVVVHFSVSDQQNFQDSFVVVPWNAGVNVLNPGKAVAFPGAISSKPVVGSPPGSSETITFTASKVGRYRMLCAVPNYGEEGMWTVLQVTSGGEPSILGVPASD